jgi:hypothetical protein
MLTLEHIENALDDIHQPSKVNGNTCANKIRAMTEAYISEEDLHHRNCSGMNYDCPNYHPVKGFEIPLNAIRF